MRRRFGSSAVTETPRIGHSGARVMDGQPSTETKRRLLVLASVSPPKRLPLAERARAVDRAWRPHHAVWGVTLRCDLACRHCSSRAGRARADELSTREALDVVAQMADLGV